MSEDIKKTINELHIYEKKVLKELEANPDVTPEEIAENQNMDIKAVMSAAGSLASKDIIEVEKDVEEEISLSDAGLKFAQEKLPERRILDVLVDKKEIHMKDLSDETGVDKKEANIAIGWLRRKNWAQIDKGVVKVTDVGADSKDKLGEDEELLNHLTEAGKIIKDRLSDELLDGFKKLNDRKNIINIKKNTSHSFKLLDKGEAILKEGFTIKEQATQLTHQQLKDGEWKDLQYRPYDINAEAPVIFAGKKHPLRVIIDEIREIFLNMGFSEDNGEFVESAFWNFDSLFQPQDHAAREMQDTFYLKNPLTCDLPDMDLVKLTAETHETGADTGSIGWQYDWSEDIARQSVLRTHTTGISTKHLYNHEPPIKMFSVGRVFRRETFDYKHLPEFHQVEGLVCDEGISYQNLLGTLKEFYKKLGFEVRFRPAYFPYTYLSTETEIYLEEKESWIELGGAGMFRPEVLKPLGINQPALAFGLGIERLAMIRYDVEDIRMLYKSDIKWLRELPIDRGVRL
ncbi:phenylalanyl-tRNA synthetase subunit alpha [Methanobrevibacter sp. YE315]|uniref:phenylalanine--tRNA ligase subunit alpha n=1 Tax=Methanobrevibacter sp. YE315 TaxID=1609968 RepID=UPI000764E93A|nr:phenylalanine--tRNA ligase subunit alpha [Methanobrevibacter sp. YE315]AMD17787.1 phenylalanyl-tRNA synthetase subunit alpha [Methanobrevibacter sp. YE315]